MAPGTNIVRSTARKLWLIRMIRSAVMWWSLLFAICYLFPHKVAEALCGGCKGSSFRLAQWSERAGGDHDFLFLENALPGTHDPATYDDGGRKGAVIAGQYFFGVQRIQ